MVLSVLAHGALVVVSPHFGQAPTVPGRQSLLAVRLVKPPPGALRATPQVLPSAPAAAVEPKPAPAAVVPGAVAPHALVPEPGEFAVPSPAETLPERYRPASLLSRGPELLTPPDENAWPSLPDTPPGRFQLELAISADGTVDRIVPLCEAQLCPAAGVYAELVSHWRFQPGDLAGEASPSRLRLEFEVGLPAEADAADDQAPRQ